MLLLRCLAAAVLGAAVVERGGDQLAFDSLFDASPTQPSPPQPAPAPWEEDADEARPVEERPPAARGTATRSSPSGLNGTMSLERDAPVEPAMRREPIEPVIGTEMRGTVAPDQAGLAEIPYFTCERDCQSFVPDLRISAPKNEGELRDSHHSLNADPVLGPRVPCIVNWEVWAGVGDPGCTVEDMGGQDCGPDSPFELMLLETCARHCVQKFAPHHGCVDGKCNPTWELRGYEQPVTCERRCEFCAPDADTPACDTCSKTDSEGFHDANVRMGVTGERPDGAVDPVVLPLLHRGPRRPSDGGAVEAWKGALQQLLDTDASLTQAILKVGLPDKEAADGAYDPETGLWAPFRLGVEGSGRVLKALTTTGMTQRLPLSQGGVRLHSPAVDYCPCECTRYVRQPTKCLNSWVQARASPSSGWCDPLSSQWYAPLPSGAGARRAGHDAADDVAGVPRQGGWRHPRADGQPGNHAPPRCQCTPNARPMHAQCTRPMPCTPNSKCIELLGLLLFGPAAARGRWRGADPGEAGAEAAADRGR